MIIQRALEPHYPDSLRAQGEALARRQAATILSADRWHVEAKITASAEKPVEKVEMQRIGDILYADCSCEFYEEYGGCVHIWAVAMVADRRSLLLGPGRGLTLKDLPDFSLLPPAPVKPAWTKRLDAFAALGGSSAPLVPQRERSIFYCLTNTYSGQGMSLSIGVAERKLNGEWGKIRESSLKATDLPFLPPHDQDILGLLNGLRSSYAAYSPLHYTTEIAGRMLALVLEKAGDGQLLYGTAKHAEQAAPVIFDPGPPWRLRLSIAKEIDEWVLSGQLERDEDRMPLAGITMLIDEEYLLAGSRISRFHAGTLAPWVRQLRSSGPIHVPIEDGLAFTRTLMERAPAGEIEWPDELRIERVTAPLTPHLRFRPPLPNAPLRGVLTFTYGRQVFDGESKNRGLFLAEERQFLARDPDAEECARETLTELGLKRIRDFTEVVPLWEISPKRFPAAVTHLVGRGWTVESEGRVLRASTKFEIGISSGIDWFGIKGSISFGDQQVDLPELLRALRKGEKLIRLGDGTFGMLPEELLRRYGTLLEMGDVKGEEIRYAKTQAGVLDVYLAALPEIQSDEVFEKVRQELQSFAGIEPLHEPPGFTGTLRDYQRAGLGWMAFLRRFGFGGCLADDMGLGKTPQVLAQLESVRGQGPSLAVVPRSLIYNWKEEAARFTPALRVLDYSSADRHASFAGYDLILTTYGILRRDALSLKDHEFEYVILDEAQAIKNAASESAKAARVLRARHRLALSGTPIENHLGELWSLFEFLNPGMLGSARVFQSMAGRTNIVGDETRQLLARALRPFILRRTKGQVARELPERIEQTIHCELDPRQRVLYDELREHYRARLLKKAPKGGKGGITQSKIQVLEALLRLRQAACHPGLIDKKYANVPSAKLDSLMENLDQVRDEGHKTLVFSQFTSLLALVRERLDQQSASYCYLDGATQDRQKVVQEFQSDGGPGVFLISLKAGGVGLNLTAAEYVFLLDPWWNPAAEAQAIDRAHRIGQARTVFAYRLIARDTVEERVVELQKNKRALADAILGEDNRLIGNLTAEDLDLLLS